MPVLRPAEEFAVLAAPHKRQAVFWCSIFIACFLACAYREVLTIHFSVALQMAVLRPEEASAVLAATAAPYPSLSCIPDEAFPLFLSNRQFLAMLDATLQQPFFK
jgi:hypothetical protein